MSSRGRSPVEAVGTSLRTGARTSTSETSSSTPLLTPCTGMGFNFWQGGLGNSAASTPRILVDDLPGAATVSAGRHEVRESVELGLVDGLNHVHIFSAGDGLSLSELESAINGISTPDASRSRSTSQPTTPGTSEHLSPPLLPASAGRRRSTPRVRQPPHRVSDEEPPRDRFHDADFQQAVSDTKDIVAKLQDVLGSGSLHLEPDSTVQRIYRNAASLAEYESPTKRVVGFVGDSGVGKSSLLNCLLDFPSLARTSNSGSACTCIATEYHYHDSNAFAIEMELFGQDALDDMLKEFLHSFRQFELHGDDMVGEEREDCSERSKVAWSTLQAMFTDRLGNSSRVLTAGAEEAILETLRIWSRDSGTDDLSDRVVFDTLEECSAYLARLTSDSSLPHERAIWPYVKKLRVYSNAHVLSKGLIFADLPGLRDLNSARRNITERYILECDEIFAVTEIFRAVTNEGVKDVVDLAKRAGLSNISIICTKSDDIKPSEAIRDWKGSKAKHIQKLWDQVDTTEDKLAEVKEELEGLADDDDEELNDEELALCHQLNKKQKQLSLKHYLVTSRNEKVTKSLVDRYQNELSGDTELKVFCTSKDDYWSKHDLPRDEALPLLGLSGIITLRRHCVSIVSEGQYQSAVRFMQHDVAALLADVELWIQLGAPSLDAEKKKEIRDTVDAIERRIKTELVGRSSPLRNFSRIFMSTFEELVFGDDSPFDEWNRAALNASEDWAGWHHSSYAAFCRNHGAHCTPAVGARNWNEELSEAMVSDLGQPWSRLVNNIKGKQKNMTNRVSQMTDRVTEDIDSAIQGSQDVADVLTDAFVSRHNVINDGLRSIADVLSSELTILRTDVFSGIRTSFLGQTMEPAYRGCISEYGPGSDRRRKGIMRNHISRNMIFEGILRRAKDCFRELVQKCEADVRVLLTDQFEELQATLDIIRTENTATDGEQDPEFRDRVQLTAHAAREILGRARSVTTTEDS
ncbi:hypothetical protein PFICI_07273 [Pestalotiopsis fici W106-1]|uniref:G domain-containing protein n=1 Tax=Pestalotiopsis fici (strain W106-1 / CGMCC3.15140) TaxID=1229662 RepID=W3XAU7_PESFW|nr:uncharacterized protein PFICI_07273 [Pestalotiopsis fici W106-1]ETS82271.1 hypothetical protein PFICI_07273 [Pestalotiopsis fici W106-1]